VPYHDGSPKNWKACWTGFKAATVEWLTGAKSVTHNLMWAGSYNARDWSVERAMPERVISHKRPARRPNSDVLAREREWARHLAGYL
jgi:hypothetical protein